ncbi:Rv3235 family protein [Arthrobacter antibioticus]|uniref:Rv3235 family protein n=1 Tax=Arthrobacter sp. H35-MC1 TaxID=3046203 RepID=UPI0024BAC7D3|nr:Rv3235 family protein [Arthrobacter sp. H35-MC1]MDJ0316500.1 Rv3235 family protein [Arthrobacter sp. H35-MC1]
MSTTATSSPSNPTLLVVKPVNTITPGTDALNEGEVIKLPGREERLRRARAVPDSDTSGALGILDPGGAERAVVASMSCKVAQAALEVLSGARSVQQLARWLDALCLNALATRARLHAEAQKAECRRQSHAPENVHMLHHQPQVHSVHCSAVSPGIFETTVVIADKTHFRAIAMRFELLGGLWKVTALQIG